MLWDRHCRLHIDGETINHPSTRVRFSIIKTIEGWLNRARIHVFAPQNSQLIEGVGKTIHVNAGYALNQRHVFSGQIERIFEDHIHGQPCVTVLSSDGIYMKDAFLNGSLQAGVPRHFLVNFIMKSVPQLQRGSIEKDQRCLPRAMVVSGCPRDFLDLYSHSLQAQWSIQDGRLQVVRKDKALQQALTPLRESELIGGLKKTSFGVSCMLSLNAHLHVGAAFVYKNGHYKVTRIHYTGDTHESPWYAHVDAVDLLKNA